MLVDLPVCKTVFGTPIGEDDDVSPVDSSKSDLESTYGADVAFLTKDLTNPGATR